MEIWSQFSTFLWLVTRIKAIFCLRISAIYVVLVLRKFAANISHHFYAMNIFNHALTLLFVRRRCKKALTICCTGIQRTLLTPDHSSSLEESSQSFPPLAMAVIVV